MRKPLVAILAALVIGCGSSANSSPVAPTASLTASASPSEAPTEAPTATPVPTQSDVFASTLYPYTLELPAGFRTRSWKPATVAWDGQARVATDSRVVDIAGTVDGTLLVWGLPWTGDLNGFSDLVKANAASFHDCTALDALSHFEVNGLAGVAQLDACAKEFGDVAGVDTKSLRAVMVKDGYGLAFRIVLNLGKESVALEDLITWLDGLTWPAPA